MLVREVGKNGFEVLLKSEPMQQVAQSCNYNAVEDLLAALGYGEVTLKQVTNRLRDAVKAREAEAMLEEALEFIPPAAPVGESDKNAPIYGVEGLMHRLAGCCNPLPGEGIVGVVTRGRGISIHRQGCANLSDVEGDRIVPVSWNTCHRHNGRPSTYPIRIQIEAIDRVGVLKDILSRLTDNRINVRDARVRTHAGCPAIIDLCIDVRDIAQLDRTFVQIRQMSDILHLRRLSQVGTA